MVITYEGVQFVKITHGDKTIAFNPISKKSKLKTTNFGADIALITAKHPDFNGPETVTRKDKEPFIINGPGEYEVGSFFIEGFLSKTTYGGEELTNTIYTIKIDNMNVVFMGAISDKDLSNKVKESLVDVDILFVPIGGDGVLPADEAYKLAVKREPKMIIPIHFGSVGEKDSLKNFLKEGSAEDVKPVDKLTVKARDLAGKEGEIVVIKPSN
jgi:L-ascorbate metabolism protein UlaG (beta-lactamase superfamily)